MPERLKAILDKITAWWKKFNTKQRSVLISIVAVVIVALVILGVVISRPTQVEIAIFLVMMLCGSWMLDTMSGFMTDLWSKFSYYISMG